MLYHHENDHLQKVKYAGIKYPGSSLCRKYNYANRKINVTCLLVMEALVMIIY